MGSLFKLRDYWSNRYDGEEFSHAHALTVGNVDNAASGNNKIIFGSFSGILRIICPLKRDTADPGDTLLEKDFGEPILQVACRPLEPTSGGSAQNLLVILFPKRVVLARVEREGGTSGEEGTLEIQYNLTVSYEVHLKHASHNFVCGAFGHAAHEMVCVQSMAGHLTIIDHNKVLLECAFPREQFLVPGSLVYCAARDCFLTTSSAMYLMCYSFAALQTVQEAPADVSELETDDRGRVATVHSGAVAPKWTFALGEDAVAVEVCRLTRGLADDDADIVVLCPATLFVLQLSGGLRYARRLDVDTLCVSAYPVPSAGACNLLVGTVGGSVHVFSDVSLEWSAKMASGAPLCLAVADLCGTRGLIVSLSTEGAVALSYLGTDPADEPIRPLEATASDCAAMDEELRSLQRAIRLAQGDAFAPANEPRLRVALAPPPEDMSTATLTLAHEGPGEVGRVAIVAEAVAPLRVEPSLREVARVPAGEAVCVPLRVHAPADRDGIVPSSLDVRIVATYGAHGSGAPRVVTANGRMPFALVAEPTPPVRCPELVMQLNTDREEPPSLLDLFPDMAARSDCVSANAMSVRYANGVDATVLVSKSACRFRLQGSTMEGLWLLADELRHRLRATYGAELRFAVPADLPLDDYFRVIDAYIAARRELVNAQEVLSRAARAFRIVQKRLLVFFRERNPTPLGAVGRLFDECYGKLQSSTDNVCAAASRQRRAAAALCCCSRFVVMQLLIKCQDTLEETEDIQLLESIFTCAVETDSGALGWEEVTTTTLESLCRNGGGKLNKPKRGPFDVAQLRQNIRDLFDQLIKGSLKTFTRQV